MYDSVKLRADLLRQRVCRRGGEQVEHNGGDDQVDGVDDGVLDVLAADDLADGAVVQIPQNNGVGDVVAVRVRQKRVKVPVAVQIESDGVDVSVAGRIEQRNVRQLVLRDVQQDGVLRPGFHDHPSQVAVAADRTSDFFHFIHSKYLRSNHFVFLR